MNDIDSDDKQKKKEKKEIFSTRIVLVGKHVQSSIDLEKSLKTHTHKRDSFFPSILSFPPHTSFCSIIYQNQFSKRLFKRRFPFFFSLLLLFFFSVFFVFLSFITLSARHTSDRARLSSIYCHRIFFHNPPSTLFFSRCSR